MIWRGEGGSDLEGGGGAVIWREGGGAVIWRGEGGSDLEGGRGEDLD